MNKGTSFVGQLEIFDLEKNVIHIFESILK